MSRYSQAALFNVPKSKSKHKLKHSIKHRSYQQRLTELVRHNRVLSWRTLYRDGVQIIKNAKRFGTQGVTNYKRLDSAIKAVHLKKANKRYQRTSISQLCRRYHVNRATMYRYYYREFGHDKL